MGLTTPAGIAPGFSVVANGKDVTASILGRFSSLVLTDDTGEESDHLEIVLADNEPQNPIVMPPTGAELQLFLGYDGAAIYRGLFVCDEVTLEGPPDRLVIHARAAVYAQTPKGKTDFQTQKSRSWKAGTTIGSMVAKMATEHGMTSAVSSSLASVQLPHIQQDAESDISLLLRLGKRYDAIAKPVGGKLIFSKRGDATTVSGVALPSITVDKSLVDTWHMNVSRRESPGTVVGFWHSQHQGRRHQVVVGSGDPVKRIRTWFPTQAEALAAVNAEYQRRTRGQQKLELTMEGHPELTAETPLALTGFRAGIPSSWIVTRVSHHIDKDGGYKCEVHGELPNNNSADDTESDTEE